MATRRQVIELLQKENDRLWKENAEMKAMINEAINDIVDHLLHCELSWVEESFDRALLGMLKEYKDKPQSASEQGKEEGL